MSGECSEFCQNSTFRFFFKNPSFGKEKYFLRKTTIIYELYGNFGTELQNKNFQRGFFTYRSIGEFHVKKPECRAIHI